MFLVFPDDRFSNLLRQFRLDECKNRGSSSAQRNSQQSFRLQLEDLFETRNQLGTVRLMNTVLHGLAEELHVAGNQSGNGERGPLSIVNDVVERIRLRQNCARFT